MTENPFAEPNDDDRTIVRPIAAPRVPVADATIVAPAPEPRRPRPPVSDVVVPTGEPSLLAAAFPLLQLLARLRNTLTPPDAGDLRERAVAAMRRFERDAQAAGVANDLLHPAHYALCASLDDVALNTPWGSGGDWTSHSLVSTFHNEVRSGERFFDLLIKLRQNPAKYLSVLELIYQCLSLGFMGRYRLSQRGPAEIDSLREELYATIASVRAPTEMALSPAWRGADAPYRPVRRRLPLWVAGSVGLAVLGGVFVALSLDLAGASDAAFERALRAPPVTMPEIVRSSQVQPPKMPPSAEPGALDRLRTFLQPEVAAGEVEVLGTESTPIVRVRQPGLFGAGSAVVEEKSLRLLGRIGSAMKDEPGAVQVIGYTDNQPIRTVRFPSNYQLSAARAAAASAIVAKTIGDPGRLSTEGRADADPIASNATADGRAANRRIEIILHRQA